MAAPDLPGRGEGSLGPITMSLRRDSDRVNQLSAKRADYPRLARHSPRVKDLGGPATGLKPGERLELAR